MINFIRGFLFFLRSIYGKPVTAGSVNLTGIEKYTKNAGIHRGKVLSY